MWLTFLKDLSKSFCKTINKFSLLCKLQEKLKSLQNLIIKKTLFNFRSFLKINFKFKCFISNKVQNSLDYPV